MKQKHIWLGALILILSLSMITVMATPKRIVATTASVSAASPAPAFSLEDQDGKAVNLADLKGKIVVLEWTNPDCPFVQRHYQADTMTMTKLASKYKDSGVVWLAINSTNYMGRDKYKAWIKEHNLPYAILDDHTGAVGKTYGAKTTPHMFVIDKTGTIAYQGAIDDQAGKVNYVAQALEELLAGKAVTIPETKPYGCSVKYGK